MTENKPPSPRQTSSKATAAKPLGNKTLAAKPLTAKPLTAKPLTERQEVFCREYLLDPNATRAAISAGYAPGSAHVQAHRMLTNDKVIDRIMENRRAIAERHCADADAFMVKLEALYRRGWEMCQITAAVRAVELQAIISGVLDDATGRRLRAKSKCATTNGASKGKASPARRPHRRPPMLADRAFKAISQGPKG